VLYFYCSARFILITYWSSYIIINNFAEKRLLSLTTAAALNITKDTFTFSQSNSVVILQISLSTSTRRLVEIRNYIVNNKFCYTWNLDDQIERSYATDWKVDANTTEIIILFHKTKLLIACFFWLSIDRNTKIAIYIRISRRWERILRKLSSVSYSILVLRSSCYWLFLYI